MEYDTCNDYLAKVEGEVKLTAYLEGLKEQIDTFTDEDQVR